MFLLHEFMSLSGLVTYFPFIYTDTDESFLAHCAVFKAMNYSKDTQTGDKDLLVQRT